MFTVPTRSPRGRTWKALVPLVPGRAWGVREAWRQRERAWLAARAREWQFEGVLRRIVPGHLRRSALPKGLAPTQWHAPISRRRVGLILGSLRRFRRGVETQWGRREQRGARRGRSCRRPLPVRRLRGARTRLRVWPTWRDRCRLRNPWQGARARRSRTGWGLDRWTRRELDQAPHRRREECSRAGCRCIHDSRTGTEREEGRRWQTVESRVACITKGGFLRPARDLGERVVASATILEWMGLAMGRNVE